MSGTIKKLWPTIKSFTICWWIGVSEREERRGICYFLQNFVVIGHKISHLLVVKKSGNVIFTNEWEPCTGISLELTSSVTWPVNGRRSLGERTDAEAVVLQHLCLVVLPDVQMT